MKIRFCNKISKKFVNIILITIMAIFSTVNSFAYTTDQLVYPAPNPTYITTAWSRDTSQTLFYSNNPEQITTLTDPITRTGVLYRDSSINNTGKFRIFWSHQNSTGGNMYIGAAIINTSQSTVKVKYTKAAYDVNKSSSQKMIAGQELLSKYLSSGSTEKTLATLLPGQKTYIGFYTNSGMLSLGMYDIVIKNSSDTGLVTNGIKVVTYISTAADPSEAINNDYILNRVGADGRGRFEYANQSMSISGSNKQLAFGTTEYYLCPLPSNDEPVGYSEIDSCSVDLHGSYGIISNITINPDKISAIILSPDWQQTTNTHYLAAEVTGRGVVTKTIPHKNGWVLKSSNSSSITIKTSLPAYDWAPLHVSVMEEP